MPRSVDELGGVPWISYMCRCVIRSMRTSPTRTLIHDRLRDAQRLVTSSVNGHRTTPYWRTASRSRRRTSPTATGMASRRPPHARRPRTPACTQARREHAEQGVEPVQVFERARVFVEEDERERRGRRRQDRRRRPEAGSGGDRPSADAPPGKETSVLFAAAFRQRLRERRARPVSYTHLDVYKRQARRRGRQRLG